jgi:hypothetical protein
MPPPPGKGRYVISIESACYFATAIPIAESFEYSLHDRDLSMMHLSFASLMAV